MTGTSFAAPFVTGSAALLMQWGILRKRPLPLRGEGKGVFYQRGQAPAGV
ncbi:MAG: S8 family serine peptidase [Enterocloster clostridioformis]